MDKSTFNNPMNMESKTSKTCVIYARVSSQSDRQDTARQVLDLTKYATANNLTIVADPFTEHISGAAKNSERQALTSCLDYCKNNGVDLMLVSELSRFGRSVVNVLNNVQWCVDNCVNVYFQKEGIQLFNADGTTNPLLMLIISVLASAAQIERDNIKYRLNSGRAKYVAEGGKVGRPKGTTATADEVSQKHSKVIKLLRQGQSVRNTAKLAEVSVSTVQRVKAMFNL